MLQCLTCYYTYFFLIFFYLNIHFSQVQIVLLSMDVVRIC